MSDTIGATSATSFAGIITQLQASNKALQQIITILAGGVAINPVLQNFTVASLPVTGNGTGRIAFATNARKPGEGAAAGTGMIVVWNPATSTWFTTLGVVVTS